MARTLGWRVPAVVHLTRLLVCWLCSSVSTLALCRRSARSFRRAPSSSRSRATRSTSMRRSRGRRSHTGDGDTPRDASRTHQLIALLTLVLSFTPGDHLRCAGRVYSRYETCEALRTQASSCSPCAHCAIGLCVCSLLAFRLLDHSLARCVDCQLAIASAGARLSVDWLSLVDSSSCVRVTFLLLALPPFLLVSSCRLREGRREVQVEGHQRDLVRVGQRPVRPTSLGEGPRRRGQGTHETASAAVAERPTNICPMCRLLTGLVVCLCISRFA